MPALIRHPLVGADLQDAYDWYANRQPGLERDFADDFLLHQSQVLETPKLYAIRFSGVRRLNLDRFPYGLFYIIREPEIWLLAVLHASRDTEKVLAERRRHFQ
jgi:plasmid stabilization system protein ParE